MIKKILSALFVSMMLCQVVNAEDQAQTMLVFDASGSMWGQINGEAKISIAKDTLTEVVNTWDENLPLGLMAYGHRKKGDCNDIETLAPVGEVNKTALIKQVTAINPKGKTPISRSLKLAAEALKFTEEKATIILISDGEETCDADPCDVAKTLEQQGIDFMAHVIGFDVDKKTDKQLRCIAESTGGDYFAAKDASGLGDALGKITEKVQTIVEKNLQLSASETEGGAPVHCYHRIFSLVDGKTEKLVDSCNSLPSRACKKSLPAGNYLLRSSYNKFIKETTFELSEDKPSEIHVVMGKTGEVELSASEKSAGTGVSAYHIIFSDKEGTLGEKLTSCTSKLDRTCLRKLPLGNYIVQTTFNKFKQMTPFEIKSGDVLKLNIVMGETGEVELSAFETKGGKPVRAYHRIRKDNDGKPGQSMSSCTSTSDRTCMRELPLGKYIVETTYNKFKQQTVIEIKADHVAKPEIIMGQTGELQLSASEEAGGKAVTAYHRIFTMVDGKPSNTISSCSSRENKVCKRELPLGQYMVESTYNKFKQQTMVEVSLDQTAKAEVVMGKTAEVEISAILEHGGKPIKAYHRMVKVVDGKTTNSSVSSCSSRERASCKRRLPLGNYMILSSANNIKTETPLDLQQGEDKQVNVLMSP